jgi:hypothetical protein
MKIDPGLAALAVMTILAVSMFATNIWVAADGRARSTAALAEFLQNPVCLARAWYQKPDSQSNEIYIWATHTDGRKLLLGTPSYAAEVWSQLQVAGIVVHSSP